MSERILVIDDETNIRTMIKLALEHAGYEVDTAADGAEGLEKFGDGGRWSLVLLDQRMPGIPGIEVQREIYRRDPNARLILNTAFGTIDLALEAIQAGASDFLRKPFAAETLRGAVSAALQRPVVHDSPVPVGLACREFQRTTINGFSFELEAMDDETSEHETRYEFNVARGKEEPSRVFVILPAYIKELARAYSDTDEVPCGARFWQALSEEALANYLWQHAEAPADRTLRIEDLSPNLQRWLDSMLTVAMAD